MYVDIVIKNEQVPSLLKTKWLSCFQAGREDRPKYAHGPQKMNPHASTTNKEKARGKAYTMVKHKVMNRKKKRSFRDKQVCQLSLMLSNLAKIKA